MRILVWRWGAFGDAIVTTPLVRYLHQQGHEVVLSTSERGAQVYKNNPHVHTLVEEKSNSIANDQIGKHMEWLKSKYKCQRVIDLNESIEVAISLHPRSPEYKLPKKERLARFNRNFYEYCFEHAGEGKPWIKDIGGGRTVDNSRELLRPELFFDQSEMEAARKHIKQDYFNILMCLSGSGSNKAWPYNSELAEAICTEIPEAHIITVGDERCKIIEPVILGRITNLSGKVPMRTSMALSGLVDCVVSPDTGLLHSSGCYQTPKIGLLGHTTKENITKHFANDFSIEADPAKAECAPCLFLIYNMKLQCPIHESTGGALCMSRGISLESAMKQVREVYARFREARKN